MNNAPTLKNAPAAGLRVKTRIKAGPACSTCRE
jgi:hypothetical protein